LQCVSEEFEKAQSSNEANLRSFLLVICGGIIFFMQSGFAMMCAGCVRLKNVQNTMLKNLLDACGAALAFYLVGYAFAFGGDYTNPNAHSRKTFIGYEDFVSAGPDAAIWFFEYTFSATSVTIVAGTLAERCQMVAYLAYSIMLGGLIYPVVAHTIWSASGVLSRINDDPFMGSGVIDFAGGGVVHLNGGIIALYATLLLGPRRGRFYDAQGDPLETPHPFPGHSVALQLLGTMILWFGWFGFNPGSALLLEDDIEYGQVAANAAVATALSGASGGICALFSQLWWEERMTGEPKFVIQMAMNGALSGLVASTSGCALMEPYAAIITGVISGWVYMFSSALLIKLRIDDAVNAIPVHMFNGLWGLIATGLFASPRLLELTYGNSYHPGFFLQLSERWRRRESADVPIVRRVVHSGMDLHHHVSLFHLVEL
jgi:Amt family ammonium transporter